MLNFYDLMNLYEILETWSHHNLTSFENILYSITINQSYSLFQSSRWIHTKREQLFNSSQYIYLSISSKHLEFYFNDNSSNSLNHFFLIFMNHSIEAISSNKLENFFFTSISISFTFSIIQSKKRAIISVITKDISKEDIKLFDRWKSDIIDVYINKLAKYDHIIKLLHLNSCLYISQ